MPRIRTIKPDFWDSPATARASLRARLFYIAMWNWADDWGVGDANPKRLLGFAFPNDESSDVEPRNFRRLAEEVSECFEVVWYEVAGREYYSIPKWEKHQRAEKKAQRYNPAFDQDFSRLYTSASDNPPLDRGSIDAGSRKWEVGNGKSEVGSFPSSDADASDGDGFSADVYRLSELLASLVKSNGHKVGKVGKAWWQSCERLIRIDDHSAVEIERVMRWATRDEFWSANIRSMPKFREQFSVLRAKAVAQSRRDSGGGIRPTAVEANLAEFNARYGGDHNELEGSAPDSH